VSDHVIIPPSVIHAEAAESKVVPARTGGPAAIPKADPVAAPVAPKAEAPAYGPEGNTAPWKPELPADAPPGAVYRLGEGKYVDDLGQPVEHDKQPAK
jgi:hypothetical protein